MFFPKPQFVNLNHLDGYVTKLYEGARVIKLHGPLSKIDYCRCLGGSYDKNKTFTILTLKFSNFALILLFAFHRLYR